MYWKKIYYYTWKKRQDTVVPINLLFTGVLKDKYTESYLEKRDDMLQDRYTIHGTIRTCLPHVILERLPSLEGYGAGNLKLSDMMDQLFYAWYSWQQGDRMNDVQYYRQCEDKYLAPLSSEHPSTPALPEACRLKTKLLDPRRHTEYKASCKDTQIYPTNLTECIILLEQFTPTVPIARSRTTRKAEGCTVAEFHSKVSTLELLHKTRWQNHSNYLVV